MKNKIKIRRSNIFRFPCIMNAFIAWLCVVEDKKKKDKIRSCMIRYKKEIGNFSEL